MAASIRESDGPGRAVVALCNRWRGRAIFDMGVIVPLAAASVPATHTAYAVVACTVVGACAATPSALSPGCGACVTLGVRARGDAVGTSAAISAGHDQHDQDLDALDGVHRGN